MFKVVANLLFWWPVKVLEPDPDKPGKLVEKTFEAQLQLIDEDEAKTSAEVRRKILAKLTPDLGEDELKVLNEELEAHDKLALRRVLVGWRDIEDADGRPLAFSEEAFSALYKIRRVRAALNRAYLEAISEDKARLGN